MKVTDVQKAKGDRYTVFVDDEYWYILDLEIIMRNHIKIGLEVDEDILDSIMCDAQRRKARERAYYLLGYRDHSKKELYDKLLKSAKPEIAAEIIVLVSQQGLLDDEKYAKKLADYYFFSKKWGAKKVYYEMLKKGIDKETANEVLSEYSIDFTIQIKEIIEKKYYDCLDDYKGKQKLIAALLRQGFSFLDIKTAIEEVLQQE